MCCIARDAGPVLRFVWEHRPDDTPFAVAEFISRDSSSLFGASIMTET